MRGKDVARKGAIWGDAFGNGDSQALQAGDSSRRGLTPVEGKGQDKSLNHTLLGMERPVEHVKFDTVSYGTFKPASEGGALKNGGGA